MIEMLWTSIYSILLLLLLLTTELETGDRNKKDGGNSSEPGPSEQKLDDEIPFDVFVKILFQGSSSQYRQPPIIKSPFETQPIVEPNDRRSNAPQMADRLTANSAAVKPNDGGISSQKIMADIVKPNYDRISSQQMADTVKPNYGGISSQQMADIVKPNYDRFSSQQMADTVKPSYGGSSLQQMADIVKPNYGGSNYKQNEKLITDQSMVNTPKSKGIKHKQIRIVTPTPAFVNPAGVGGATRKQIEKKWTDQPTTHDQPNKVRIYKEQTEKSINDQSTDSKKTKKREQKEKSDQQETPTKTNSKLMWSTETQSQFSSETSGTNSEPAKRNTLKFRLIAQRIKIKELSKLGDDHSDQSSSLQPTKEQKNWAKEQNRHIVNRFKEQKKKMLHLADENSEMLPFVEMEEEKISEELGLGDERDKFLSSKRAFDKKPKQSPISAEDSDQKKSTMSFDQASLHKGASEIASDQESGKNPKKKQRHYLYTMEEKVQKIEQYYSIKNATKESDSNIASTLGITLISMRRWKESSDVKIRLKQKQAEFEDAEKVTKKKEKVRKEKIPLKLEDDQKASLIETEEKLKKLKDYDQMKQQFPHKTTNEIAEFLGFSANELGKWREEISRNKQDLKKFLALI